ncbi:hypothetical protein C8R43DRAFT_945691 [Mycena crocata]|nr:hypothetical protein C8R43DRAFT_945691 [Mycena crocata]
MSQPDRTTQYYVPKLQQVGLHRIHADPQARDMSIAVGHFPAAYARQDLARHVGKRYDILSKSETMGISWGSMTEKRWLRVSPFPDIIIPFILKGLNTRGIQTGFREMMVFVSEHAEATRSVVAKVFTFAEAKEAFEYIKCQSHVGKVVIQVFSRFCPAQCSDFDGFVSGNQKLNPNVLDELARLRRKTKVRKKVV